MTAPIYTALLHYPVYKKTGEVITTSITPLDLHDIARSCHTFGVKGYFVVNPMHTMQHLAKRVVGFWRSDYGAQYNQTRTDALSICHIVDHLEDGIAMIEEQCGRKPVLVVTTARKRNDSVTYSSLRERMKNDDQPYLIMFGTGWGLIDAFLEKCDVILEPINGPGEYNHLSVRSAAAIILDRLCNER